MSDAVTIAVANPELAANIDAIAAAVADLTATLDGARGRLEAGEAILLDGLEARMAAIHAAVAQVRGDEAAARLLPSLQTLAESLERLEGALKARVPRPAPTAPPRKAAEAYGAAAPPRFRDS